MEQGALGTAGVRRVGYGLEVGRLGQLSLLPYVGG